MATPGPSGPSSILGMPPDFDWDAHLFPPSGDAWAVFITAANPPAKVLNRVLLLIQGFTTSERLYDSNWTFLSSTELPPETPPPTSAPFTDDDGPAQNDFAGMSLANVNAFVRGNLDALEDLGILRELWLVIDDIGIATDTCVICKSIFNAGDEDDADTWDYTDEWEALRVPMNEAHRVMSGLDGRGREFCDYEWGPVREDGTRLLSPDHMPGGQLERRTRPEAVQRAELVWSIWREQGLVD